MAKVRSGLHTSHCALSHPALGIFLNSYSHSKMEEVVSFPGMSGKNVRLAVSDDACAAFGFTCGDLVRHDEYGFGWVVGVGQEKANQEKKAYFHWVEDQGCSYLGGALSGTPITLLPQIKMVRCRPVQSSVRAVRDTVSLGAALLMSGKPFSDVTLLVGPEAVPVLAHRCILASQSEYFQAMLRPDRMVEGGAQLPIQIPLPHEDPQGVETLIYFLYTGTLVLHETTFGSGSSVNVDSVEPQTNGAPLTHVAVHPDAKNSDLAGGEEDSEEDEDEDGDESMKPESSQKAGAATVSQQTVVTATHVLPERVHRFLVVLDLADKFQLPLLVDACLQRGLEPCFASWTFGTLFRWALSRKLTDAGRRLADRCYQYFIRNRTAVTQDESFATLCQEHPHDIQHMLVQCFANEPNR